MSTNTSDNSISESDDNSSHSSDGYCEGDTFRCESCDKKILIKNCNHPGGDRNFCTVCDSSICINCIVTCTYCEDDSICINCVVKCDKCDAYICTQTDCLEDALICKKCKKYACDNCMELVTCKHKK